MTVTSVDVRGGGHAAALRRRWRFVVAVPGVLVVAIVAWIATCLPLLEPGGAEAARVIDLMRCVAAGAYLLACATQYLQWRATRDPFLLRPVLLLAALSILLPFRAVYLAGVDDANRFALARAATVLAVLVALAALAVGPREPMRRRPMPAPYVAGCLAGLLGLAVATAASASVLAPAGEAILAGAWLLVARFCLRRQVPSARAFALAGVVAAAGELLRAVALVGPHVLLVICPLVDVLAAAIVAGNSARRLHSTWCADEGRVRRLADRLTLLEAELQFRHAADQERLHDARSTIAGVVGASQLLVHRPGSTTAEDAATLRGLMEAELNRLELLLDPRAQQPDTFLLADVLGPVLDAHRVAGLSVQRDLAPIAMVGRPHLLATVLDNLLRNTAVHAPGSSARVTARACGATVVVTVEDGGPGISPSERATVLGRGVRGSDVRAAGSGLGLYNAATAVARCGGTLELGDSRLGGLRVRLTLPLCPVDDASGPEPTLAGWVG